MAGRYRRNGEAETLGCLVQLLLLLVAMPFVGLYLLINPNSMLMCGKVTNDNLIDSSHYFRNTDQYEKLMWGFSYISFCLSKHFGEGDVFVSFLLTASL